MKTSPRKRIRARDRRSLRSSRATRLSRRRILPNVFRARGAPFGAIGDPRRFPGAILRIHSDHSVSRLSRSIVKQLAPLLGIARTRVRCREPRADRSSIFTGNALGGGGRSSSRRSDAIVSETSKVAPRRPCRWPGPEVRVLIGRVNDGGGSSLSPTRGPRRRSSAEGSNKKVVGGRTDPKRRSFGLVYDSGAYLVGLAPGIEQLGATRNRCRRSYGAGTGTGSG
jgi:hypothetical protein